MFQSVLNALKGLGGGIAKGIGTSTGLDFLMPSQAMYKAKSPITGKMAELAAPPGAASIWEQIGEKLGSRVGGRQVGIPEIGAPKSDVFVLPRRETTVGKPQMETLLEQLARML